MSTLPPRNESLQNYNYELVECIEDLRRKREEVDKQICKEEDDKAKVQKEIVILQDRLQKLNESLARKIQARNEYDKTIQETEAAYTKLPLFPECVARGSALPQVKAAADECDKILESAQTLLHVLKRESVHLGRKASGLPSDGGLVTSPVEDSASAQSSSYEQRARRSHNRAGG